jgi:hypothetical protein
LPVAHLELANRLNKPAALVQYAQQGVIQPVNLQTQLFK